MTYFDALQAGNSAKNVIFKILVCPTMRRNNSLFSRKNFNLIKNLKGNRQMQYVKQQIFLSLIQHLNIFARVNKKEMGGRMVSASGSETSVSSSMPTSAIIYDAYTSIIKKKTEKKKWAL